VDRARDGVLVEDRVERGFVAHVRFVERDLLAGDPLDARDRFALAVHEIVDHDHVVIAVEQFHARMRADKARAARHQNCSLRGHAGLP
jgi:hypothetical protein